MGTERENTELLLALNAKYDRLETKLDRIANKLLALSKENSIIAIKREEKDERIHDALSVISKNRPVGGGGV